MSAINLCSLLESPMLFIHFCQICNQSATFDGRIVIQSLNKNAISN